MFCFLIFLGFKVHSSLEIWKQKVLAKAHLEAPSLAASIEAQFFERYGDAQAFAINGVIVDYLEKSKVGTFASFNNGVRILNEYVKLYRVYPLILVADSKGTIVLSNSQNSKSETLNTEHLFGKSFQGDESFESTKLFLTEQPQVNTSIHGTFVGFPKIETRLEKILANGEKTQVFSAPIQSPKGEFLGAMLLFANQTYFEVEVTNKIEALAKSYNSSITARLMAGDQLILEKSNGPALGSEGEAGQKLVFVAPLKSEKFLESLGWRVELEFQEHELLAEYRKLSRSFVWLMILVGLSFLGFSSYFFFLWRRRLLKVMSHQKSLNQKIIEVQERERAEIAQEIHDELGQYMTLIHLELSKIKNSIFTEKNEKFDSKLQSLGWLVNHCTRIVRNLSAELSPTMLKNVGLEKSLKYLCSNFEQRSGLFCRVECYEGWKDPDYSIALNLYRICQEAMTNSLKHAKASEVVIAFKDLGGALRLLEICDDGVGDVQKRIAAQKSPAKDTIGIGIEGMKRRAEHIGGAFEIGESSTKGTRIRIQFRSDYPAKPSDVTIALDGAL